MKKTSLLFIPSPGIGHLRPTAELAKLLLRRYDHISVTLLIINLPFESSLPPLPQSPDPRLQFITLSPDPQFTPEPSGNFLTSLIESHAPPVRAHAAAIAGSEHGLAGFVVGMFCTALIDVADDFGVPSYVFFASSAAFLGLMLHVQRVYDEEGDDVTELKDSEAELVVASCVDPVPARALPSPMLNKEWCGVLMEHARRMRKAEGVLVNSFEELESHAFDSLREGTGQMPSVYPVGPLLNLTIDVNGPHQESDIMTWLDDQPQSSVVFLCFGSMGSFDGDQVGEIACALEQSGHRFLWSLRQPPPKGKFGLPTEYENPDEVLPPGFRERTVEIGRIIGWAPQVAVLAHVAVGGFVTHCGWNSTLESIWFGVPVATWPMHSEQQFNAFQLVQQMRLAVEIKNDYRSGSGVIVSCDELERGIRCVMERDSEVRKRVEEMSESAKKAVVDGGSSYSAIDRWICNVMENNM